MGICEGRVCIVTGAGRGIGREHALMLAAQGARVVVNDIGGEVDGSGRSTGPAQDVVDEIVAAGGEAVVNGDDISTWAGAEHLVQQAVEAFGRLDVLINNAGILRDRMLANMTEAEWDAVIAVHLKGTFGPSRHAAAYWREQTKAGEAVDARIINTSSPSGIYGNVGQTNYGAAKAGLVGFTRVLAVEGAKNNIKANAIAPVAKTRMTEELLGAMADKLDPGFITPVVAWLAHEDVPVSGEVYSCGGGHVARIFTGVTQGWTDTESLTVEDIRDHFDEIRDETGYAVPANLTEELMGTLKALGG